MIMKITLPSSTYKMRFYFCSMMAQIAVYHSAGILLITSHQLLLGCFKYQEAENFEET